MRHLLLVAVLVAVFLPASAQASKPPPVPLLGLTSETLQKNPSNPPQCLSEDDYDVRTFYGFLTGRFATSYRLCGLNTDGFTAGGIGIESDVFTVGTFSDLTISAPDGSVHSAVLMATTRSQGVTTQQWTVCWCPPYSISTDTGTDPLAGGTWTLALSGTFERATWYTRALMTDAPYQGSHCPVSQQNLTP